jgi:hypothetical protein
MFRLLTKTAEVGRALPVGWGVDDGNQESFVRKKLTSANEEVSVAPLE